MADLHCAHQTEEAYVISICENYCKSPVALAGYVLVQRLTYSDKVCSSVNARSTPVLNTESFVFRVGGNEAGIGGGVPNSGINCGICRPHTNYANTVKAGGFCVLRHDTVMQMNCASEESPGDIFGRIAYCQKKVASMTKPDPTDLKSKGKRILKDENGKVMTDKNGNDIEIEIFETEEDIGAGYNYGNKIILQKGKYDDLTIENEMQTRRDDARDHDVFDGKLTDENGKTIDSQLEAERRSDAASARLGNARIAAWENKGLLEKTGIIVFGQSGGPATRAENARSRTPVYEKGEAAMKKAEELIKQGRLEEAQVMADSNEGGVGSYIQSAIDEKKYGNQCGF